MCTRVRSQKISAVITDSHCTQVLGLGTDRPTSAKTEKSHVLYTYSKKSKSKTRLL